MKNKKPVYYQYHVLNRHLADCMHEIGIIEFVSALYISKSRCEQEAERALKVIAERYGIPRSETDFEVMEISVAD